VVKNVGRGPVWARASAIGVPVQDLPASSEGFDISRSFFTADGNPADLGKVKQSDMLVVVLKGRRRDGDPHQALVVDLLPAGFEIENRRLSGSRKTDELAWLGDLSEPIYSEFRDDRFVAALDLGEGKGDFQVAYLVRAVTPGKYRLPASSIEDMYRPGLRARTATGQVTVAPYQGTSQ
jgi:alpha-2-macroglobulin